MREKLIEIILEWDHTPKEAEEMANAIILKLELRN